MLSLNHAINSSILLSQKIITTTITTTTTTTFPTNARQKTDKRKTTYRRRPTLTKVTRTNTTTTLVSICAANVTTTVSYLNSSNQQQPASFDDPYSAKTGIKTAAILGGMLVLVILYLLWKARARLCQFSSVGIGNSRLSTSKFDLDYWLKQVDLLEAKEAERQRGGLYPYLELPTVEPRDNREATAQWIVDAYRHWRLVQYRKHEQLFHIDTNPPPTTDEQPYQRRRYLLRRFFRRFCISNRQNPSVLFEHQQALINDMRPSIVSNNFIPPILTANSQLRRTSSWPRLKSTHHQLVTPMSALQTHLVRKRLLKRTSRTTIDI